MFSNRKHTWENCIKRTDIKSYDENTELRPACEWQGKGNSTVSITTTATDSFWGDLF